MAAEVTATDAADRVGFGHDRHPFGPGEPLRLGGIDVPGAPRLHGHSDGDVALHAIADAILGAAGLGDLGRLAPSDARTPRGIASGTLVEIARARALDAGWRVRRVELTITGARPRFGETLDAMRDAIARLLELDAGSVAVKGSSGNLQGPEGEGRAIAAEALVTLSPAGGPGRAR
jgi:2-C-methyl-D-erythritol 2,4-cyclodiphosphate synthase